MKIALIFQNHYLHKSCWSYSLTLSVECSTVTVRNDLSQPHTSEDVNATVWLHCQSRAVPGVPIPQWVATCPQFEFSCCKLAAEGNHIFQNSQPTASLKLCKWAKIHWFTPTGLLCTNKYRGSFLWNTVYIQWAMTRINPFTDNPVKALHFAIPFLPGCRSGRIISDSVLWPPSLNTYLLCQVSFRRYSPLSLEVVEKPNECKSCFGPQFCWERRPRLFYDRMLARSTVHRSAKFGWVPSADVRLRNLAVN